MVAVVVSMLGRRWSDIERHVVVNTVCNIIKHITMCLFSLMTYLCIFFSFRFLLHLARYVIVVVVLLRHHHHHPAADGTAVVAVLSLSWML